MNDPSVIETERLRLIPHTADQLLTLIERPDRYEQLAGLPAAAGLREFFVSGEVSVAFIESLRSIEGADPWRLGFAVVDPAARAVVGSAGFKGAADPDGVVEIAYGIAPAFQGRGYATEVARALVEFVRERSSARTIRAHTLPETNASTTVLGRCGFGFRGEVIDPEDGRVWRWERPA
jgi:[ribosomal protein S5]-alanine N-acetyltransferase